MYRDPERDDPRHRYRVDDDPRDDPRERFGNEEDRWSREYRRAYADEFRPSRMHDDSAYEEVGYEPEAGRPGQRVSAATRYERDRESRLRDRSAYDDRPSGGSRYDDRARDRRQGFPGAGGYRDFEERWRSGPSGDPYGYDFERPADRRRSGQGGRTPFETSGEDWQEGYGDRERGGDFSPGASRRGSEPRVRRDQYGQPAYGRSTSGGSGYDQGDLSAWYGGDTGMGNEASSGRDRRHAGQYPPPTGGGYAGRGPRGYRRSDDRILEDVCELLTRHGQIDASDIEVQVHQGTVTLRGIVDSGQTRRLTEEVVEDITGVRDIQNDLRVRQRMGYSSAGHERAEYPNHSSAAMADTGTSDRDRTATLSSTPAYGTGVAQSSGISTRSGAGQPGVGAGAGPSQHGNPWTIHDTMEVVGADGETVGQVKMVRGTDFLVERSHGEDVYVPFSGVQTVNGSRVMVRCRAGEVEAQGWPTPGLTGASQAKPSQQG